MVNSPVITDKRGGFEVQMKRVKVREVGIRAVEVGLGVEKLVFNLGKKLRV